MRDTHGVKGDLANMPGLAEIASVMMSGAERRIDVSARNVSNMNTPGFQSGRVFSSLLEGSASLPSDTIGIAGQGKTGALKTTGNPLDLATDRGSVLMFRSGSSFYASRCGQLRRDVDGHLVDGRGGYLQASGGGDVTIGAGIPRMLGDGTVLIDGQAEGRIGLFDAGKLATSDSGGSQMQGGDLAASLTEAGANGSGLLHQGAIVPSNVDLSAEMVELTRASRQAEAGARLFQVYDDLLGKAATKLAEMGG